MRSHRGSLDLEEDLGVEESSMTQYDSPSDSGGAGSDGYGTRGTGRSHHRRPMPMPVHSQGMYRADGLVPRPVAAPGDEADSQATLARSSRGQHRRVSAMYDPDLHHRSSSKIAKDQLSGDSLSFSSQPDYVRFVQSRPMSRAGPAYTWGTESSAGTSQQLYFNNHKKYFRRRFCSICFSISIVAVIIAVIAVVSVAVYLAMITADDSQALQYEMGYKGKFRIARGDFYHQNLANRSSQDYILKAEQYTKMLETAYSNSYLSDAFRRAAVEDFSNDSLTVFFRVHLDRRKVPTSVLNTEEAVRDVITQEVMSLQPKAFREVSIDIDSIEIARDGKDDVMNSHFVADEGSINAQDNENTSDDPKNQEGDEAARKGDVADSKRTRYPGNVGSNHRHGNRNPSTFLSQPSPFPSPSRHPGTRADLVNRDANVSAVNRNGAAESSSDAPVPSDNGRDRGSDGESKLSMQLRGMIDPQPIPSSNGNGEAFTKPDSGNQQDLYSAFQDWHRPNGADGSKQGIDRHDVAKPTENNVPESVLREGLGNVNVVREYESDRSEKITTSKPGDQTNNPIDDQPEYVDRSDVNRPDYSASVIDSSEPIRDEDELDPIGASELGSLLSAGIPYESVDRIGSVDDERIIYNEPEYMQIQVRSDYGQSHSQLGVRGSSYHDRYRHTQPDDRSSEADADSPPVYDSSPWNPIVPTFFQQKKATINEVPPSVQPSGEERQAENLPNIFSLNSPSNAPENLFDNRQINSDHFNLHDVNDEIKGELIAEERFVENDARIGEIPVEVPPSIVTAEMDELTRLRLPNPRPTLAVRRTTREPEVATLSTPASVSIRKQLTFLSGDRTDPSSDKILPIAPKHQSATDKHSETEAAKEARRPLSRILSAGQRLAEILGAFTASRRPATTRTTKRTIIKPPSETTTEHVVIVKGLDPVTSEAPVTQPAPTEIFEKPATNPSLKPVTSYSGIHRPLRPKPPSFPLNSSKEYVDNLDVSTEDMENSSLSNNSSTEDPSAPPPSRNQVMGLIRLMSLRYPGMMANVTPESIQSLLKDPKLRRRLVHPFASFGDDRSRSPNDHQRNNTKFLKLGDILVNTTAEGDQKRIRRDLQGRQLFPVSSRKRRPLIHSSLNSTMLEMLASITRVKVSSYRKDAPHEVTAEAAEKLKLTAFPTDAPPRNSLLHNHSTTSSVPIQQRELVRRDGDVRYSSSFTTPRSPLVPARAVDSPFEADRLPQRPTRLPNSSKVHVIQYEEGESVEDVLDKIYSMFSTKWDYRQNGSQEVHQIVTSQLAEEETVTPSAKPNLFPVENLVREPIFHNRPAEHSNSAASRPIGIFSTLREDFKSQQKAIRDHIFPSNPGVPANLLQRPDSPRETVDGISPSSLHNHPSRFLQKKHRKSDIAAENFAPLFNNIRQNKSDCSGVGDMFCPTLGRCLPVSKRCDRVVDCPGDEVDEVGCSCLQHLQSEGLHKKICDGTIDCEDRTDEQFCDWCTPSSFICPGVKRCVPRGAICDGMRDCPDGADEKRCVALASNDSSTAVGGDSSPEPSSGQYRANGLLLVRRRGRWGHFCMERDAGHSSWDHVNLGRAVCKALSYQDAEHVYRVNAPANNEIMSKPFFKLSILPDSVASRMENGVDWEFAPTTCPQRSVLDISCSSLQCGVRPRHVQRQSRIVGGGSVRPGDWPWQAAMYRDGEYQCGATLISDRWLISAGHCYLWSSRKQWVARLGAHRRDDNATSPHEQLKVLSHVFMHPEYRDVGFINDIALLRLQEPAKMTDFVRPACLSRPDSVIKDGAMCTVVGWGQLFESGRVFPDILQEVRLPLISTQECRKKTAFLALYKITDRMFCAGYERGGRDACLGDSGGPLLCQEEGGSWALTGVTSNGYGCARAGRPGVYTKVASYRRWIDETIYGPLPPPRTTYCAGHRCPLGECLPAWEKCDGTPQCSDGSDERNCRFSW